MIHYCMSSLEIDCDFVVLGLSGEVISCLYAAGEVIGGVHGSNQLGGDSLPDRMIFRHVLVVVVCAWMFGVMDVGKYV